MALTQSARLWDEEVVPALRKRLETESRTLAKRMSAVSLASSTTDTLSFPPSHSSFATFTDVPSRSSTSSTRLQSRTTSPLATTAPTSPRDYREQRTEQPTSPTLPPQPQPRSNGKSTTRPTSQRSRTYSQPYHTDLPNGKPVNGSSRPRGTTTGYGTPAAGLGSSSVSANSPNPHGATRPLLASPPTATAYYPETTMATSMLSASTSSSRSPQPRPSDVKPTRIPVASRTFTNPATTPNGIGGSSTTSTSPQLNGYGSPSSSYFPLTAAAAVPTSSSSPTYADSRTPTIPHTSVYQSPNANSSQSTVSVPSRQHSGILNEQPPFEPYSMSSNGPSPYGSNHGHGSTASSYDYNHGEPAARPSIDSEEHPFEHWYRGEVSRNGGVGELRVGKRQEMLDIANYGHSFYNTNKVPTKPLPWVVEEGRRRKMRKRADSVDGVGTEKERQRGSLYLDEDGAQRLGELLDESPLTDLEGDGEFSDVASEDYHRFRHHQQQQYQNQYGEGDSSLENGGSSGYNDTRSTTPTPAAIRPSHHSQNSGSTIQQHGSNGHGVGNGPPPTRIPAPQSRKSSDTARVPTPTQYQTRGNSEPPMPAQSRATTPSSSRIQAKTPPPHPSIPSAPASASLTTPSSSSSAGGKKTPSVKSPASSKKSGTKSPHGGAKGKSAAMLRKEAEEAEAAKRRSVAYYPTPDGGDGGTMEHAIPVWTQPKRDGNWDDVVLPAVARKKGLDGYEQMDGSPKPAKAPDHEPAPAPGTFGFRYRPSRGNEDDGESIPLDEVGPPTSPNYGDGDNGVITEEPESIPPPTISTPYDETPLPVHRPPDDRKPPLSEYPPPQEVRKPVVPSMPTHQVQGYGTGQPVGLGLDLERAYEERKKAGEMELLEKEEEEKGGCCKCVIM